MRIGYLYGFEAYPVRGGNHLHAMELSQGFLEAGHQVLVVEDKTMPGAENYHSDSDSLNRFLSKIDILYVRIDARFTRHWRVLNECMKKNTCPVVWEINSPANEGLAFSWLGGKTAGDDIKESHFRRLKRMIHALRQWPGVHLEEMNRRNLSYKVSAAICVSSLLGNYAAHDLGIHDVVILPNGGPFLTEQEIEQRRSLRRDHRFTVLYSGSAMFPWQGLNYLSDVIRLAGKQEKDILFVLAVNKRVPGLPESDNVKILEHLDRDQILNAVCGADACVSLHPEYPWSKYNFHNSPLKMFEYMACMKPVVASNHGQMRELINDGVDGILCDNNPANILDKLIYLRDNPDKANSIGQKGWVRIQNEFNWPKNVDTTLGIFDRLVNT